MDLTAILNDIRARGIQGGGIELASFYYSALAPCLEDSDCQKDFFRMASLDQWQKDFTAAQNQLVYTSEDTIVEDGLIVVEGGMPRKLHVAPNSKDNRTGMDVVPGACMVFDGTMTTNREDRDRDVLEPSGADLDERMPLLYQHVPLLNIGKYVRNNARSDKRINNRYAIIDNEAGRDAAQLAEFGALRLSHGFIPLEFDPREKDKNDDGKPYQFPGWHVRKYKTLETSLVSIPSNEDGIITAFSRAKLHHPLIKAHALRLWKQLPPMVRGGWDGAAAHQDLPGQQKAAGCTCGAGGKATTNSHKCPDCGVKLVDGKCPKCGKEPKKDQTDLTDPSICPLCGTKMNEHGQCPLCGWVAYGEQKPPKDFTTMADFLKDTEPV
jgi:hypothetical protein